MYGHMHVEYVEGCFRCDLSREEAEEETSSATETVIPSERG